MSARDVMHARNGVVCLFVCCMHIFLSLLDRTSDGVLFFFWLTLLCSCMHAHTQWTTLTCALMSNCCAVALRIKERVRAERAEEHMAPRARAARRITSSTSPPPFTVSSGKNYFLAL